MIYYTIALLCLVLGFMRKKPYCILMTLILVLFAGLRANTVGPDTPMYQFLFEQTAKHDWRYMWRDYWYGSSADMGRMEIGYWLMNFLLSRITTYNVFKFICSAIAIVPAGVMIYRYSERPYISFFSFFTLTIFCTVGMSMMRQGCAFGISLIAVMMLLKGRTRAFLITTVIAVLFHQSAVCIFPLYVLFKLPYKRSYNIWLIGGLVVIYALNAVLFAFLTQFSRIHYSSGDAGGEGSLYYFIALLICLLFVREAVMQREENRRLLYMLIYTVALWAIGMNLAAVYRLAAYTQFFMTLYISNLIPKMTPKFIWKPAMAMALIISFLVMTTVVMRARDQFGYYPYYFVWE